AYSNYALESGSFLRSDYAYPKLLGNTIVDNHLLNPDVYEFSGAVHSFKSKPLLINNIVYGNTSNCIENFQVYLSKPYYTRYNLVEGGYSGEGNINSNPAFLELTDAYYVPSETSLCKDAGTLNTDFLQQPTTDIYGNQRVYNNYPDIGCAELHPFISLEENNNQHEVLKATAYPNPASNRIKFKSNLITNGLSEVLIYDIRGRKVKTIYRANEGELEWDLTDSKQTPVPAGVYLYSIVEGERTNVGKVVVIR
ncbi:MAG: T9SS type A sorting domain-containing protein, partial [Candidatus Zophobacter franzmannii]|nr:T9SS type A sorting domain-containing protein [Candidatus Zophobacter franzmannii]